MAGALEDVVEGFGVDEEEGEGLEAREGLALLLILSTADWTEAGVTV